MGLFDSYVGMIGRLVLRLVYGIHRHQRNPRDPELAKDAEFWCGLFVLAISGMFLINPDVFSLVVSTLSKVRDPDGKLMSYVTGAYLLLVFFLGLYVYILVISCAAAVAVLGVWRSIIRPLIVKITVRIVGMLPKKYRGQTGEQKGEEVAYTVGALLLILIYTAFIYWIVVRPLFRPA